MKLRLFLLLLLALLFVVITCKKDDENNPSASITLTSPNGGETWNAGSTHAITWTDNDVTTVTISLSLDAGATWQQIATAINNTHTYAWTIAPSVGATCRIRVADTDDANVYDESDANFAIAEATQGDHASGSVGLGNQELLPLLMALKSLSRWEQCLLCPTVARRRLLFRSKKNRISRQRCPLARPWPPQSIVLDPEDLSSDSL